jgi:hypothetical protein
MLVIDEGHDLLAGHGGAKCENGFGGFGVQEQMGEIRKKKGY